METLASRIEHQLQGGRWDYNVPHATVYERELKRFWPLNEEHRQAKIAQFAKKHGFRLRFYSKGLYAIFDEGPPNQRKKVKSDELPVRQVLQPVT
jgi:hypothetical protein